MSTNDPTTPRVWIDGTVRDAASAAVPVLDHGLLYGDGVFEGIRITGGRIFRLQRHLERLSRSARAIGLDLPLDIDAVGAVVCETAAAYDADEAYVRLLVTRGSGPLSLDPTSCSQPRLLCIVAGIRMFTDAQRRAGLSLVTASNRRPAADMLDPQVKSLNYLNNVLAKRQARLGGYDDALILNTDGRVAEASGANVLAVIDGELVTPPPTEGALPGITRDALLEGALDAGMRVAEKPLARYALLNAREAMLCGSGAGVVPLASLDGTPIGDGSRDTFSVLVDAWHRIAAHDGTPFRDAGHAAPRDHRGDGQPAAAQSQGSRI